MLRLAVRQVVHFFGEKDGREWLLERLPKNSVCAEIGVFQGRFSELILSITRPQKLHLIDPWKYESDPAYARSLYGGVRGKNQERMDKMYESVVRVFQSKKVQVHRATSTECCSQFPDNYFDWIYVDGNHQYEFVKADLEVYFPKLKPGGLLAGDDYARKKTNWTNDGVTRAVDEIVASGMYQKVLTENHQFLLVKPEQN
jgi:hypothetical protein